MSERSRQVSSENLERVRKRLRDCSLSQAALAEDLRISRSTVSKFFGGEPVDRGYFEKICERLDFEWEEVVAQPPEKLEETHKANIDQLVQETREKIKPIIHERCGTMRVLDMEQPIELTGDRGIYTTVNILERISGRRRLEIAELLENFSREEFDRPGLSRITDQRVPGLEAVSQHSKLMVLGKPGAGKTTFLKYLAMQCIEGLF